MLTPEGAVCIADMPASDSAPGMLCIHGWKWMNIERKAERTVDEIESVRDQFLMSQLTRTLGEVCATALYGYHGVATFVVAGLG